MIHHLTYMIVQCDSTLLAYPSTSSAFFVSLVPHSLSFYFYLQLKVEEALEELVYPIKGDKLNSILEGIKDKYIQHYRFYLELLVP